MPDRPHPAAPAGRHLSPFSRQLGLALLCCLGAARLAQAANTPRYYSIRIKDRLVGYASIAESPAVDHDKPVRKLVSRTVLKIALLGQPRRVEIDAVTTIVDGQVRSYRATNAALGNVQHTDVDIERHDKQGIVIKRWSYRQGADRGEPTRKTLPHDTLLLGANVFAHWERMAREAERRRRASADPASPVELRCFIPEIATTTTLRLARSDIGPPGEGSNADAPSQSVHWKGSGVELTVDRASGHLVRMAIAAQQLVLEQADAHIAKQVDKMQAEEVLRDRFVDSNVVFDDMLKVRYMKARIDVQVTLSGSDHEAAPPRTAMQSFDGTSDAAHVVGVVEIRSVPYAGKESPPYPAPPTHVPPELRRWLQPSPFIESDDPAIGARARELTRGARSRWDAVRRIGAWVHREIRYTMAATPSARLALDKKAGDCGPHSTLMTAMLRAAGIPARLVGGLLYTPTFGGSFGQHAWVEVHMGPAGWVPVDPTTGEFTSINATHIRLFEGVGGVLPKSVEVLAYEPANATGVVMPPKTPRPVAWKPGTDYTFAFRQGGRSIGQEVFSLTNTRSTDGPTIRVTSRLDLSINANTRLQSDATFTMQPNGIPRSYHRTFNVAGNQTTIDCRFEQGKVEQKITGARSIERDVALRERVFWFDNNLISSFALLCSQLDPSTRRPIRLHAYHPSSMQILTLTFTPKGRRERQVAGRKMVCYEFDVAPIRNTFSIAEDGRLVRVEQGDLVIELKPKEAAE